MKLHPEDPRLTAYLLGELPAEEAAAVERAIAEDPALQEAAKELVSVRDLLMESLTPKPVTLQPSQRENIMRAAKASNIVHMAAHKRSWKPWLIPLSAAAVVTIVAWVAMRQLGSAPQITKTSAPESSELERPNIKRLPAPGPADPGKALASTATPGSELPALRPRSYLAAADFPTLELPVQSGKSSLDWIRDAVLTKREKPDRNAVRLEEILNSFTLRPAGVTVVARIPTVGWHPDNRENGATSHAATIATETLACPWKPSATLVVVSIKGNPYNDCEIKAAFRANPDTVRRYRLLGFSPVEGPEQTQAPLPTRLAAKSSNTLVIEVEPSAASGELGAIEWSVNDQTAAPVNLARHGAAEPSDDARFAALICTYAQWLTDDPNALIDTDVLAGLAREIASSSLSGDRADFLNLIDRSLGL